MKRSPTWRAFVVATAVAMTGSGVALGVTMTGALSQSPTTVTVDAGILRLHLSNSGGSSVSYTGPLSVGQALQPITISSTCGVTTSGSLLSFASTGDQKGLGLGLVSNGLGVRTKDNCATTSGRISAGQSITVALGRALGPNVRVAVAELDIEGKHSANLGAALDGGQPATYQLSNSADNGPDSGVGDNDRVVVTGPFASITLSPVGGEVSLEGGGDGTFSQYLAARAVGPIGTSLGTADTIFKLVGSFDHA